MATVDVSLSSDAFLTHIESPYHSGPLQHATHIHTLNLPTCGDQVTLELAIDQRRIITQARFDAKGCTISRAAASILCEHVEGLAITAAKQFQAPEMLALLRVPLTPHRQQCGLLPFKTLKAMLYVAERGSCVCETVTGQT